MTRSDEMLERCLRDKYPKDSDNMFVASMDHSPSEQLPDSGWITSAIVLANRSEDDDLAKRIAQTVKIQLGGLLKWSKARRPEYKEKFNRALFEGLGDIEVFVFAYSRNREWILNSTQSKIELLRRKNLYTPYLSDGKKRWVKIGPYTKSGGEEQFIEIQEKRAIMVFDIVNYVSRIYQAMWRARPAGSGDYLHWSLWTDNFPGDARMGSLFDLLLSMENESFGGIRCFNFAESDTVLTDKLADNLAGMLNGILKNDQALEGHQDLQGLVHWEIFELTPNQQSLDD